MFGPRDYNNPFDEMFDLDRDGQISNAEETLEYLYIDEMINDGIQKEDDSDYDEEDF